MKHLIFLVCFLLTSLFSEEPKICKNQILYLMQSGETQRSIQLYQDYVKGTGKPDFSILEQMGYILLREGAQSEDEECQLLSMYGLGIAGSLEGLDLYEKGLSSPTPLVQMATIQFLSSLQDDEVEQLLFKAFSSPYLMVRLEAAHNLALRKSDQATGIIDNLMQKLPPFFHVYFPELFGMIGTSDATGVLKRMLGDKYLNVRLAVILAAAKFGRDDFLNEIRAIATHSDQAEQETCAAALGYLKDSHSIPLLKTLSTSKHIHVKLAACHSLSLLGNDQCQDSIKESALMKNPLAIPLLANMNNTEPLLVSLLDDYHFHIRVNSALALLKKRDIRCIPTLLKILLTDEKDLGFQPIHSLGHSLMAWKVIPSATQYAKKTQQDIPAITLALKEQILQEALELPEEEFVKIAREIFKHKQHELVPFLVYLLENLKTPKSITLLQEESRHAGAPFIRTYCHLALFRLKVEGPHREFLSEWIQTCTDHDLIRFRSMLPWIERQESPHSSFQLTPEETSRLLIEVFEALAESHDIKGVDILLSSLKSGHPKNRYALAGLLLKAIQ